MPEFSVSPATRRKLLLLGGDGILSLSLYSIFDKEIRMNPDNPIPKSNTPKQEENTVSSIISRPLESKEDKNINIPEDHESLQNVLNSLPYFLRHTWAINVNEPVDEDIIVPSYVASKLSFDGVADHLRIIGDKKNPVPINSILVGAAQGTANPLIRGIQAQNQVPYVDEPFSRDIQTDI